MFAQFSLGLFLVNWETLHSFLGTVILCFFTDAVVMQDELHNLVEEWLEDLGTHRVSRIAEHFGPLPPKSDLSAASSEGELAVFLERSPLPKFILTSIAIAQVSQSFFARTG